MEPSAYGINLWIDLPWTIEQLYHCLTWITKTDYEKLREDHNSLRMQKFHHRHTSLLIWSTSWWWWWSSSWRVKPGKFMTKHTGSNCHSHHHHHHHHHHNVGELRFVPVRGVDGWLGANWREAASVAGRRWRRPDIPEPLLPSFAFFLPEPGYCFPDITTLSKIGRKEDGDVIFWHCASGDGSNYFSVNFLVMVLSLSW